MRGASGNHAISFNAESVRKAVMHLAAAALHSRTVRSAAPMVASSLEGGQSSPFWFVRKAFRRETGGRSTCGCRTPSLPSLHTDTTGEQ